MPLPRTLFITSLIAAPPAYYVYTTINRLEATYPPLAPSAASTPALRTPSYPVTHRTPHIDVYSAKIPAKALQLQHGPDGRKLSLEEAWAKAFLQSPILRLYGRVLGGFSSSSAPGDAGEHGFRARQKLLNGAFEVVRPPAEPSSSSRFLRPLGGQSSSSSSPTPLLVRWSFSPQVVGAIHYAAEWGYPWRFMSGGRHEWSVGQVDSHGMVEVRFGSAHDYEWVSDEGNEQKTIPEWTARLHRAYARWLLDERVAALRKAVAAAES